MKAQDEYYPIQFAIFVGFILLLIYIVAEIFFGAPDLSQLKDIVIETLVGGMMGGLQKQLTSLTTLG